MCRRTCPYITLSKTALYLSVTSLFKQRLFLQVLCLQTSAKACYVLEYLKWRRGRIFKLCSILLVLVGSVFWSAFCHSVYSCFFASWDWLSCKCFISHMLYKQSPFMQTYCVTGLGSPEVKDQSGLSPWKLTWFLQAQRENNVGKHYFAIKLMCTKIIGKGVEGSNANLWCLMWMFAAFLLWGFPYWLSLLESYSKHHCFQWN